MEPRSPKDTPELADTIDAESAGVPRESSSRAHGSFDDHEVVANRYQIIGLLGVGGMGAVYRVRDARLEEDVALKILRREFVDAAGMRKRFLDEVKLARKVTHKNVARTYDVGEHRGGLFLTMELLDGTSLGARIEREGPLPLVDALAVAEDVAAGLGAAHAAGVIHRDLKPDNVISTKDGRAVVTDFGIARAHVGRTEDAARTGGILGTPAYMAPEQLEGAKDLDARADLYALGEVLYEMLTGARVWPEEDPVACMAARLVRTAPDPRVARPDTPRELSDIVARLLARRREDRYASAGEVGAALAAVRATARGAPRSVAPPAYPKAAERGEKTVAVLPLKNEGAADYVASGLHEDLVDTLSMTRGLRVRPLGVINAIDPGAFGSSRELGRSFDVQILVQGSLRAAGPDLRLSVRAISVDDDFQIWAGRFVRPAGDVLGLADDAAIAIATALTGDLDAPARTAHETAATDLYLRARAELRSGYHSFERLAKVTALFDAAVELSPKDPRVLAGAATAHLRHAFWQPQERAKGEVDRARDLADRAISLAPQLGEPWIALANVRLDGGDVVATVRALHTALRVAPKTAEARAMLGHILLDAGALTAAIDLIEGAKEIDSSLVGPRWDLARGYALRGDRDAALEVLEALPSTQSDALVRAFVRARLCLWAPDDRWKKAALADEYPREGMMASVLTAMHHLIATGEFPAVAAADLHEVAESGVQRARLLTRQVGAELRAASGASVEDVVRAVDAAMSDSAGDICWMDRCPLFEAARAAPGWAPIRARVEAGASKVRAAFFDW